MSVSRGWVVIAVIVAGTLLLLYPYILQGIDVLTGRTVQEPVFTFSEIKADKTAADTGCQLAVSGKIANLGVDAKNVVLNLYLFNPQDGLVSLREVRLGFVFKGTPQPFTANFTEAVPCEIIKRVHVEAKSFERAV